MNCDILNTHDIVIFRLALVRVPFFLNFLCFVYYILNYKYHEIIYK